MATYNEPARPYDFVIKDEGSISYDSVTLSSGAGSLLAGSVIGRITKRAAAAAIPGAPNTTGGTGTGAMSGLTFGPDVQVGNYVVTLTATSATASFTVRAPDLTYLPTGNVATAYQSSHINFTVANGGTMTTGDSYTVAVTAGANPTVIGATGTGTCTSVTLGKLAQFGTYQVINRAVVANGGDFEVLAPDGSSIGRFLMGTSSTGAAAFTSDHVNFTLTDATDFILGNAFNIIVAGYHTGPAGMLWDPTAVNGVQDVFGIITHAAEASSAVTVLTRIAEVDASLLAWKSTVTAAQKTQAYRQMASNLLIARS